MGCSPLLAKAKEGGHPMSKERAETHVSHGPPNPPCARSAMVGFMSISSSRRRLQLFKPRCEAARSSGQVRDLNGSIKPCCRRQKNLCSGLFHSGFCTFGSGISNLGRAQRSLALSVLGGEACCMILAHHCRAAGQFLNC